jgi:hypothetical protein
MTATSTLHQKMLVMPLEKGLKRSESGTLMVRGKYTSDAQDQVGDIITRSATEKAQPAYRQWGNIRRMHLPDPVGKVRKIGVEDGLEWNEVEIEVIDPKAVFEVENELLPALSVGILVNWEKLQFLEGGGWIINEYQLAEISLVDHPANYDAVLDLKSLTPEQRNIIRAKGFTPGMSLEEKTPEEQPVKSKDKNITAEDIQPTTPADETVIEEAVSPEVEPVVEEETPETVDETVIEEPVSAKSLTAEEVEALLKSATAPLFAAIESITKALQAPAEEPEVPAAPAADDTVADLQKQVEDLNKKVLELSTGTYEGATTTEELPENVPAPETPETPKPKSLREAVKLFAETHTSKQ